MPHIVFLPTPHQKGGVVRAEGRKSVECGVRETATYAQISALAVLHSAPKEGALSWSTKKRECWSKPKSNLG